MILVRMFTKVKLISMKGMPWRWDGLCQVAVSLLADKGGKVMAIEDTMSLKLPFGQRYLGNTTEFLLKYFKNKTKIYIYIFFILYIQSMLWSVVCVWFKSTNSTYWVKVHTIITSLLRLGTHSSFNQEIFITF